MSSPPTGKSGDIFSDENAGTYVLTAQCSNGGSLKWREGPYDCEGQSLK